MNGHNSHSPSQPTASAPAILWESAARNPWSATLLLVLGLNYCGPIVKQVAASVAQVATRCPDPVRTVAKSCDPPCKPNEVCSNGTCVNVASERNMTLAADHDPLPRVILEIRAR